jgi:hypothetical protein
LLGDLAFANPHIKFKSPSLLSHEDFYPLRNTVRVTIFLEPQIRAFGAENEISADCPRKYKVQVMGAREVSE